MLTVDDETEAGIFDPDELRKLFAVTEREPVRRRMTGFERRLLYQLAAETGFRSKECRTITWGDIDLDGNPPTVRVTIKRAKNDQLYDQPLTPGLPKCDGAYRARNFHSPRHTFASNLVRAGVTPKVAMELMRHSDINLTLRRCSHVLLPERASAIAELPDLSAPASKAKTEAA